MLYRTIYIGNPAYLRLKSGQMKVIYPDTDEVVGSVPIEDMGLLVIDHSRVTISHRLISALLEGNVAIVSCNDLHLPHGIMLPYAGHSESSERMRTQLSIREPLRKQLWKQTVEAKISNQAALLRIRGLDDAPMSDYLSQIKSGDASNMEGIAAQYYWRTLIAPDFIRGRDEAAPNCFLNFGYAILRSIIARALVETGLLLVIGIFHRNKYNPFCLADDIMEPYRPFIDTMVMDWCDAYPDQTELTKEFRYHILQAATMDVGMGGATRPLIVAAKTTSTSLYKCFCGEQRSIAYPEFVTHDRSS